MAGLREVFDAPPPASYGQMRTGPVLLRSLVVTLPPVIQILTTMLPMLTSQHSAATSLFKKQKKKEMLKA